MSEPFKFYATLKVRFNETDLQGHVNFGQYYFYFDVGATEYMEAIGYSYDDMLADGVTYLARRPVLLHPLLLTFATMVAAIPRLSSTGFCTTPTALRSAKFCMLRAPTCMTSTYCAARGTSTTETTSVTIASPVRSRTRASMSAPSRSISAAR